MSVQLAEQVVERIKEEIAHTFHKATFPERTLFELYVSLYMAEHQLDMLRTLEEFEGETAH